VGQREWEKKKLQVSVMSLAASLELVLAAAPARGQNIEARAGDDVVASAPLLQPKSSPIRQHGASAADPEPGAPAVVLPF